MRKEYLATAKPPRLQKFLLELRSLKRGLTAVLLHGEIQLINVHVVRCAIAIAINLVVNRDAIPAGGCGRVGLVDRCHISIQADGLE